MLWSSLIRDCTALVWRNTWSTAHFLLGHSGTCKSKPHLISYWAIFGQGIILVCLRDYGPGKGVVAGFLKTHFFPTCFNGLCTTLMCLRGEDNLRLALERVLCSAGPQGRHKGDTILFSCSNSCLGPTAKSIPFYFTLLPIVFVNTNFRNANSKWSYVSWWKQTTPCLQMVQ